MLYMDFLDLLLVLPVPGCSSACAGGLSEGAAASSSCLACAPARLRPNLNKDLGDLGISAAGALGSNGLSGLTGGEATSSWLLGTLFPEGLAPFLEEASVSAPTREDACLEEASGSSAPDALDNEGGKEGGAAGGGTMRVAGSS